MHYCAVVYAFLYKRQIRGAKIGVKLFDINQKITTEKAKLMNPVVLAYIGDGVHTLYIRQKLALSCDKKSNELNKIEATMACATAQSNAMALILPHLTEEEDGIFRRARNSKKGSKAKNSTAGNYARSTGFEAVVGYLYITGQTQRLNDLMQIVYESEENS